MGHFLTGSIIVSLSYVCFWVLRAAYRLYLHPLRRYPGPVLATVSKPWYEWYWNYYQKGQLLFQIERLHAKLGPVIRIAPNELHINDPQVYLDMTKVGSQFIKDPEFYHFITFPGTSIGETDPVRHRIRRQVLTPAFSPTRVQDLAPMVEMKVDQLLYRFDGFAADGEPVNVFRAIKAFTMDIISEIVLGKELGCMRDPLFKNQFIEYLHSAFDLGWTATAFPNMTMFSLSLPEWLSESLFPIPIMEFKKKCVALIDTYLKERDVPRLGMQNASNTKKADFNRSIVIDMLVDPNSTKDHSVLNAGHLAEEVMMLLSAGNDTTSNAIIVGIYQALRSPGIIKKINEELLSAFPDLDGAITYEKSRRLPYLTAVIKETLRYSNPLPGRAPRVVSLDGWTLYNHKLPPKTIINTSSYLLNRHPSIWSEPEKFIPDRWLAKEAAHLDKYMTSFYRGTRQCLGKDLAFCEMCTLLANLFRRYELRIHNTTDEDMKWIDLLLTYFTGRDFHATITKRTD